MPPPAPPVLRGCGWRCGLVSPLLNLPECRATAFLPRWVWRCGAPILTDPHAGRTQQMKARRVGKMDVHFPALPNRTGGSPASGFPVGGRLMDWRRHSIQAARKNRPSRAVVANPLTPAGPSTVRSSNPSQPGVPAHSDAHPSGTIRIRAKEMDLRPQHHVPAVNFQLLSTRGCRPDAVTFSDWPFRVGQVRDPPPEPGSGTGILPVRWRRQTRAGLTPNGRLTGQAGRLSHYGVGAAVRGFKARTSGWENSHPAVQARSQAHERRFAIGLEFLFSEPPEASKHHPTRKAG